MELSTIKEATFRNQYLTAEKAEVLVSQLSDLVALNLSNNRIDKWPRGMPLSLIALDMSFNAFKSFPPSNRLKNLIELKMSNNEIDSIVGLATATSLEYLDLSNNRITKIQGLEMLLKLKLLQLENNAIGQKSALRSLSLNRALTDLTLHGNPISIDKNYKTTVFGFVSSLIYLDGLLINPHSKKCGGGYTDTYLNKRRSMGDDGDEDDMNDTSTSYSSWRQMRQGTSPSVSGSGVGNTSNRKSQFSVTSERLYVDGNGFYDTDSFLQQRSSLPWRNPPQIVPKDRKGQPVSCVQGTGTSRSSSASSPGSNLLGSLTMNASTASSRGGHNHYNHNHTHTPRHHPSSSPALSSGGSLSSKGQRTTPGRPISPSSRTHHLAGVYPHSMNQQNQNHSYNYSHNHHHEVSPSHYHHPYHLSPPSSSPRRLQQQQQQQYQHQRPETSHQGLAYTSSQEGTYGSPMRYSSPGRQRHHHHHEPQPHPNNPHISPQYRMKSHWLAPVLQPGYHHSPLFPAATGPSPSSSPTQSSHHHNHQHHQQSNHHEDNVSGNYNNFTTNGKDMDGHDMGSYVVIDNEEDLGEEELALFQALWQQEVSRQEQEHYERTSSYMGETESGGGDHINAPISNTLHNRSALLRAISNTERLRKRQEHEQREKALRHPSIHPSSVGNKTKTSLKKYRQSLMSSGSPVSSTKPLVYSSYPVNASYPSSLELEKGLEEEKYHYDSTEHHPMGQHHHRRMNMMGSALDDDDDTNNPHQGRTMNHSERRSIQEGYNQEKGYPREGYQFKGYPPMNHNHVTSSHAHTHRLQSDIHDYPPPPPLLSEETTADMVSMQTSLQQQMSMVDNVDEFGEMERILQTSEVQGLGQGLGEGADEISRLKAVMSVITARRKESIQLLQNNITTANNNPSNHSHPNNNK